MAADELAADRHVVVLGAPDQQPGRVEDDLLQYVALVGDIEFRRIGLVVRIVGALSEPGALRQDRVLDVRHRHGQRLGFR